MSHDKHQIIQWLGGDQPYIVCAYYTENYADEIKSLHQSLQKFKLNHYLFPHEDLGYWEKNTRAKPAFILQCLEQFKDYNIVYTDADSVFCQTPELFEKIQEDISVFCSPPDNNYFTHDYLTGTLFFKNNTINRELITHWIAAQNSSSLQVDQDGFHIAMRKMKEERTPPITIYPLPFSYIKVTDQQQEIEPVIEHFQASRKQVKLRNKVRRYRNRAIALLLLILIGVILYYTL